MGLSVDPPMSYITHVLMTLPNLTKQSETHRMGVCLGLLGEIRVRDLVSGPSSGLPTRELGVQSHEQRIRVQT
jgi:hypothetical protein